VFSLSDAEICEKRKVSKKKLKDMAVLAKTPGQNRFF